MKIFENKIEYYRRNFGTFNIDDYTKYSKGCVLHIKADDGVYARDPSTPDNLAVDGETVLKWVSRAWQYPDDFMYQIYAPGRPTYHTNALNGLPIVSFVKENAQTMTMAVDKEKFDIYTPSIFLVGKWHSGSGFCGKGSNEQGPDGQSGGNTIIHRKLEVWAQAGSGGQIGYFAGSDGVGIAAAPCVPITDWHITSIVGYRNNLTNINVDGVDNYKTSVINASHFNNGSFGIGSAFSSIGAEPTTCDIAELIILNYAAPDWLKQHIINYLSLKWGIAVTNTVPAEIPTRGAYVERAGF